VSCFVCNRLFTTRRSAVIWWPSDLDLWPSPTLSVASWISFNLSRTFLAVTAGARQTDRQTDMGVIRHARGPHNILSVSTCLCPLAMLLSYLCPTSCVLACCWAAADAVSKHRLSLLCTQRQHCCTYPLLPNDAKKFLSIIACESLLFVLILQ